MDGAACCPAPVPSRFTAAPEAIRRLFSITDRRRGGWGEKAALLLHIPSPEPSPQPCFPLVAVPAVGALASAGASQQGGWDLQSLFLPKDFPSARPGSS